MIRPAVDVRGVGEIVYSIRYKNDNGITERSEFLAFESDAAAADHAHLASGRHFIVEVWKGDDLLSRTFLDDPAN